MITAEKLTLFEACGGDPDAWARMDTRRGAQAMDDADWAEIDELRRRLHLCRNGLASPSFERETEALLRARAENDAVADRLRRLA